MKITHYSKTFTSSDFPSGQTSYYFRVGRTIEHFFGKSTYYGGSGPIYYSDLYDTSRMKISSYYNSRDSILILDLYNNGGDYCDFYVLSYN